MHQSTIILAIESSCDDTSVAVIKDGKVLSNVIQSQLIHQMHGGVIPESASRLHIKYIVDVTIQALDKAGIEKRQLNAIAYTHSPGLIGSLLVGACFAKGMAQTLEIPLIAVNHIQAHVLSNLIESPKPDFPFLCLTVSGGHTQIVLCKSAYEMEIIGETIDDAAGEAFDKAAKMLGIEYPGGPLIDKYAQEGNANAYKFNKPKVEGLDFSFSGLKTNILYFLREQEKNNPNFIKENLNDICASIQHTITDILIDKLVMAYKQLRIKNVCIAGGVSANSSIRKKIQSSGEKYGWQVFIPKMEYCTDNAAMIAIVAHYKYLVKDFSNLETTVSARTL